MSRVCRPAFVVQGLEDYLFLGAGRDGDVIFVQLFAQADSFDDPAAAFDAVSDHFGGRAVVHQIWVPDSES